MSSVLDVPSAYPCPAGMDFALDWNDGSLLVRLSGVVDEAQLQTFRGWIRQLVCTAERAAVVDLSGLSSLCKPSLAVFVGLVQMARSLDIRLRIYARPDTPAGCLLREHGLDRWDGVRIDLT